MTALSHQTWIDAMHEIERHSDGSTAELARFSAEILSRCGDSPALAEYLDRKALAALERTSV